MTRKSAKPRLGSDFEDYLREQGQLESATVRANKVVLALQLAEVMKRSKVSESELARRMHASPAVVRRLLHDGAATVTLSTIVKAATALGRTIDLRLTRPGELA